MISIRFLLPLCIFFLFKNPKKRCTTIFCSYPHMRKFTLNSYPRDSRSLSAWSFSIHNQYHHSLLLIFFCSTFHVYERRLGSIRDGSNFEAIREYHRLLKHHAIRNLGTRTSMVPFTGG